MKSLKEKNVIVLIYNSFKDPLFYNLLLVYLKQLNTEKKYNFFLVTHEQEKYQISAEEKKSLKRTLEKEQIFWYPLNWHAGSNLLIKFYDFLKAFLLIIYLKIRRRSNVIFTFTNIAGAFGYIYSRILRMKFIIFSYEPHCEFMADLGLWDRNSLKFRISKKLDYLMAVNGEFIITGTQHMIDRLKEWPCKGDIYRLPTPVDEDDFNFRPAGREMIRRKLGMENRDVVLYLGKFGDLYYKEEIPLLFKSLLALNPHFFFLIVTSNDFSEINKIFQQAGLKNEAYFITGNLPFEEVKNYMSAADIGISAVPPSPSQKFRSPTKVGEYLCCGLPYITIRGVSEDDYYAEKYHVGVVMKEFSKEEAERNEAEIVHLLREKKESVVKRCRETGIAYRGKHHAIKIFNEVLDKCFD